MSIKPELRDGKAIAKLLLVSLGEIRRPRAEIRRPDWLARGGGVGFQVSGFGFLSDFGPRISGFAIASGKRVVLSKALWAQGWMLKQPDPTLHKTTRTEITPLFGQAKLVLDETAQGHFALRWPGNRKAPRPL